MALKEKDTLSRAEQRISVFLRLELLARGGVYAHLWNLQLQEEQERPKLAVGNGLAPT